MIAQATAYAPDYNTAINAASRLFQLIDRKPRIDSTGVAGLKLVWSLRIEKKIQIFPKRLGEFYTTS